MSRLPLVTRSLPPLRQLGPPRAHERRGDAGRRRRQLQLLLAVCTYGVVALVANWPAWPGDPSRIRDGDPIQMVWFLAWTPHALIHGVNPFFTTALNYPSGVNLAQNTLAPLLGLMTAPLTLLVSPVASVNLLLWLSYTLSASSMFCVLRRFVRRDLAAFVGGALYGFSPFLVTQSLNHLNLAFVPLPPVILLSVYELFRPGQQRPARWGTILGLLVAAQVFIAPEVAATTVVVATVAILVLGVAKPGEIVPAIRRGARGVTIATLIIAAAVAYPLWAMTAGPYRYHGPAYPSGTNADLLGTVQPTPIQEVAPSGLRTEGGNLLDANPENGSYLGLPLLVLMVFLIVACWNRRWIRFAGVMVVLTTVLSLGSHLTVDNHITGVPLPFGLLLHIPGADNVIAARFALYAAMFSSLLVAVGLDEVASKRLMKRSDRSPGDRTRHLTSLASSPARTWAAWILTLVSAVSLVPPWPFPTAAAEVPAYFSGSEVQRVPTGSVALMYPYPTVDQIAPDMWQAVAGYRFALIGGYALFKAAGGDPATTSNYPAADGTSTNYPAILQPEDVQRFLYDAASPGSAWIPGPVPRLDARLACDTRIFLRNYHVGTVLMVSAKDGPPSQKAYSLFMQALGRPSTNDGTVAAWYGVQRDLPSSTCRRNSPSPGVA